MQTRTLSDGRIVVMFLRGRFVWLLVYRNNPDGLIYPLLKGPFDGVFGELSEQHQHSLEGLPLNLDLPEEVKRAAIL